MNRRGNQHFFHQIPVLKLSLCTIHIISSPSHTRLEVLKYLKKDQRETKIAIMRIGKVSLVKHRSDTTNSRQLDKKHLFN